MIFDREWYGVLGTLDLVMCPIQRHYIFWAQWDTIPPSLWPSVGPQRIELPWWQNSMSQKRTNYVSCLNTTTIACGFFFSLGPFEWVFCLIVHYLVSIALPSFFIIFCLMTIFVLGFMVFDFVAFVSLSDFFHVFLAFCRSVAVFGFASVLTCSSGFHWPLLSSHVGSRREVVNKELWFPFLPFSFVFCYVHTSFHVLHPLSCPFLAIPLPII